MQAERKRETLEFKRSKAKKELEHLQSERTRIAYVVLRRSPRPLSGPA